MLTFACCRTIRAGLGVAAVLALAASALLAERPRVYAVTGVRIVTAPGQVIEKGAIVLRDGLVEAVGAEVQAPDDAQVIEGQEGWSVYPAFIDAAARLAVKQEEEREGGGFNPARIIENLMQREEEPKGSPHPVSRITPEKAVVEELDFTDNKIDRHRKLGFAIAHVIPDSGILRGRSAAVALREGENQELIVRPYVAQVASLQSGGFFGGGYPTSKMGAVAAMRQAFYDAVRQREWIERFEADPRGMKRPGWKTSDAPLLDVARLEVPMLFVSNAQLDPRRFKMIANEFGLLGMNMAQGLGDDAGHLLAGGMPVLLPLEMPDKPELEDHDSKREAGLEEMRAYLAAPKLPKKLRDEGLDVAFVTAGMDSAHDFPENLTQVVEDGELGEAEALAALTTAPARLLGLEKVAGTLDPGKIANLLVVEGELFVDKPKIRYLFVDGIHEEFDTKEARGDPDAQVDPRGEWEVTSEMMGRSRTSTWTIEGSPGNYSGYTEGERGRRDFGSVELEGNLLRVALPTPMGGEVEAEVVIEGEAFEGEAQTDTPRGSLTIKLSGKRTSKPKGDEQ